MLVPQVLRCALLGLFLLLGGLAQATEPGAAVLSSAPSELLPQGHWEGGKTRSELTPRICLDLLPKQRILVTFHDSKYRNPVVMVGSYVLSPSEQGHELLVSIQRIVTKEIGPCRRFWMRMDMSHYEVFGMKLFPAGKLLLRVRLLCEAGTSKVELCLRDPRPRKEPSQDHCQLLSAPIGSKCQPGRVQSLDDILPPEKPSPFPPDDPLKSL